MQNLNDIWRELSGRIHFYTKQTSKDIPDSPGLYAWYLPLWLFKNDIDALNDLIQNIYLYDSDVQGAPELSKIFAFNWASFLVTLGGQKHGQYSQDTIDKWKTLSNNTEFLEAFKVTLMEASILLPPLYVGRTNNLKTRYSQHLNASDQDRNNFNNRFSSHIRSLGLKLKLSDLIFCCVLSKKSTNSKISTLSGIECDVSDFIEQIILKLAKPPFSAK